MDNTTSPPFSRMLSTGKFPVTVSFIVIAPEPAVRPLCRAADSARNPSLSAADLKTPRGVNGHDQAAATARLGLVKAARLTQTLHDFFVECRRLGTRGTLIDGLAVYLYYRQEVDSSA